ncbi:MAG: DUF3784 domain-containing protein [Bacteroidales bacterium]|nr:DUF3784 domain-containing protein [Bacteroidales bacterium]
MLLGAVIFAAVWCLIALLLRHYPETMAGYNTMPKKKRARIDVEKIGSVVSRAMYAGVPFVLSSPLMPSEGLYVLMLVGVPVGLLIAVTIYVNVCKKKFEK